MTKAYGLEQIKDMMSAEMPREIDIAFEAGHVVDIGVLTKLRGPYSRHVDEAFGELTGPDFYGRVKLQYQDGVIALVKIERNIKP